MRRVYRPAAFVYSDIAMDTYDGRAHTWIKWVHTGLSMYCYYYNETTSWIDFMPSRAIGGSIMQAALLGAVGYARFFAKFQKNSEKIGEKFRATAIGKLQPINCNR